METPKYIGSREVAEMLDIDLEYFQNKFVFESGLNKIAYRFTPGSPRKWLKNEVLNWAESKKASYAAA